MRKEQKQEGHSNLPPTSSPETKQGTLLWCLLPAPRGAPACLDTKKPQDVQALLLPALHHADSGPLDPPYLAVGCAPAKPSSGYTWLTVSSGLCFLTKASVPRNLTFRGCGCFFPVCVISGCRQGPTKVQENRLLPDILRLCPAQVTLVTGCRLLPGVWQTLYLSQSWLFSQRCASASRVRGGVSRSRATGPSMVLRFLLLLSSFSRVRCWKNGEPGTWEGEE